MRNGVAGWSLSVWEMQTAEDRHRLEPADQLSAEKIFEARWALILLEHALTVLGRQYAVRRKEAVFETLKSLQESWGERPWKPPTKRPAKDWG